jgi:hypothetical protein
MIAIIIAVVLLVLLIGAYYAFSTDAAPAAPSDPMFTRIGCDGQAPPMLGCAPGKTIKSGVIKYGRWDVNKCTHPTVNANTPVVAKEHRIPEEALGQRSYQYPPIHEVHGDPVPNVLKQYEVKWTCG